MTAPCTPFFNRSGGFGITGSPSAGWTFTKTAQASTAETIVTVKVSDDSTGKVEISNLSATDSVFVPLVTLQAPGTNIGGYISFRSSTDTGTSAVGVFDARIGAAAVSTRPAFEFRNNNTSILSLLPLNSGANSALSWGTQTGGAPTFTTRSIGNRAIWYSNIGASDVDFATGVLGATTLWHSVARATNVFDHRWYGGTTNIMSLRGDGLLTTTGGRIVKLRVALTTPVTLAATDYVIVSNLTTPGAVAVNLPASPAAGLTYIIKDGKGDAAANNITITPAAGNIDGAGTLVIAANYGRAVLVYNGTEWNVIT